MENAIDRKMKIEMRQYAYNEIRNQRNPNSVIDELVRQGMEKQEATDLINGLLQIDMEAMKKTEEEIHSMGWFKDIVIGTILLIIGIGMVVACISSLVSEHGFFYITGIIPIGIYLLIEGISKKPSKSKRK